MTISSALSECLTFSVQGIRLRIILFQYGHLLFCNLPVAAIVRIHTSLRYHFQN